MKKIILTLLFGLITILAFGQAPHLTVLGIPITGNISTFQQKLIAKKYSLDTKYSKDLPAGQRAYKGKYSGYNCSLIAYFYPETKSVYKVRIAINFFNGHDVDDAYTRIKRSILGKYKNTSPKTGNLNGYEMLRIMISDNNENPLGIIDMLVYEGDEPNTKELVIGYKDWIAVAKENGFID